MSKYHDLDDFLRDLDKLIILEPQKNSQKREKIRIKNASDVLYNVLLEIYYNYYINLWMIQN